MQAGTLRDRITILKKTGGKDGLGQPLPEAWIEHVRLWANVKHPSGLSAINADADTSVVKASMRIRWRKDITADMRVLFDGRTYEIDAVLPGDKREHVDLACRWVK